MVWGIAYLIISFATAAGIYCGLALYNTWWLFFVPIITIPVAYVLCFALTIIILFIWSKFLNVKKEIKVPNKFYLWMFRNCNYQLCLFARAKITTTGKDLLPKEGRFILVYNHISKWDPMCIEKVCYHNELICVTKDGNEKIPVCGPFIHNAGFIPVNRSNNLEAAKSAVKAVRWLKEDLASICIAPEGTRNQELIEKLLPFHEGTVKIAKMARVPIVVTTVKNTNQIHKNFPFKRTKVQFDILKVIPEADIEAKDELTLNNEIREIMLNNL